jgi:glutaredoxin
MSQLPADSESNTMPEVAPLDPPSERVQALLDELAQGQHADEVSDLVGELFEVPPHVFFSQHPEARVVVHRAVAEAVTHPRTTVEGSPGYEAALDLLQAGYVQAGRSDLTAAEQALGAQARAIAQAMTFAATKPRGVDPSGHDDRVDDVAYSTAPPQQPEPVKVYCAPHCQACNATVRSLSKAGVPFDKIELESLDPGERAQVVAGHRQAPVVHAPGVGVWDGHRPTELEKVAAQHAAGPGRSGAERGGPM